MINTSTKYTLDDVETGEHYLINHERYGQLKIKVTQKTAVRWFNAELLEKNAKLAVIDKTVGDSVNIDSGKILELKPLTKSLFQNQN